MNPLFSTCLFASLIALPVGAQTQSRPQAAPPKWDWPLRSNDTAPAGKEVALQAPLARAILEKYRNENPQRGDRLMHIVYWTPADRDPAPLYRQRLSDIMVDIQSFYRREMARNGFGPLSFKLKSEPDGLLQMTVARGSQPREHYSGKNGDEIRDDCIKALQAAGIDGDKETFLIFCNLGDWDAAARSIGGDSPYYASGTTRKGTAWQVDTPILNLNDLKNVAPADKVKSGQYGNMTLARYNSIFIGGIAHELGHALSMPHNAEDPDTSGWGKSLMGAGNRTYGEALLNDPASESGGKGSFLPFADALRLASHPSFNGSVKGIEGVSNAEISEVKLSTDGRSLTYSARVKADPPVYGVVAYLDPTGGQDYDARTATAIPDANGRFSFSSDALVKGKGGTLRVVTLQANGAASSAAAGGGTSPQYPYEVAADGTVSLSRYQTQQQLSPLEMAVRHQDRQGVQAALQNLEKQGAAADLLEIARVQLALFDKKTPLSPAQATGNAVFLSESKPVSATVGYLAPTYNRLPSDEGESPLFIANGQRFARGIYAHAPATHTYDLGARWKRLSGVASLAEDKDGLVGFTILGDGRELWKSKPMRSTESAPFDISVEGIQRLELRTDDGGNGTSSDWGLWLDPRLAR